MKPRVRVMVLGDRLEAVERHQVAPIGTFSLDRLAPGDFDRLLELGAPAWDDEADRFRWERIPPMDRFHIAGLLSAALGSRYPGHLVNIAARTELELAAGSCMTIGSPVYNWFSLFPELPRPVSGDPKSPGLWGYDRSSERLAWAQAGWDAAQAAEMGRSR